ncbi:hypothetical protein NM688_g3335 [Phlebia brevispora]|uniref:Uncharacterized protein n=1 Tax=Phlebia brevispora TaxID=194682 RepID=A0ACC1T689_9APHY|nr:hypothetical protein NM688_g3335 [Phlebia brevispora]
MSSTSSAEIISAYRADLIYNYSVFAALTIVCYEFIATFRHEYELVWKRRWTGATWLFLANRYSTLVNIVATVYPANAQTCPRCYNYPLQYFLTVLENLPMIIIAVFSALRVFALLGRAYIPAAFTFALNLVPVAVAFYQTSQARYYYVDDPVLGSSCYCNSLISPLVVFYSEELLRSYLDNADTFHSDSYRYITYRHVREASSIDVNVGFGGALLRYGSLFFTLPNIILSRFLINLRQINAPESGSAANFSRFSPPNFRMPSTPSMPSIIGNLGEPLADNEDDLDDEDYVVADADEDGTGAAVNSGEEVETSDVMDIGRGEIEVPTESV